MSSIDNASLSSVAASLPFSETVANTAQSRQAGEQALRQKSSAPEATNVALGYEYAALAIGESSRQVQQAEELQQEREERHAAERRQEREAALKEAGEQQLAGRPQQEQNQLLSGAAPAEGQNQAAQPQVVQPTGAEATGRPAPQEAPEEPAAPPQRPAVHVDVLA